MKKAILFTFLIILFSSCNNDDDNQIKEKEPVSSFTYSPINPQANQDVKFSNNSTNAYSYEWDFGNGKKSTSMEPTISFSKGTYTVTLRAYSKSKELVGYSAKSITVSPEYTQFTLSSIKVNSISFTDEKGIGWDTNSGPDIYFKILSNGKEIYKTDRKDDIKTSDLPFTIETHYINKTFPLSWQIVMYDWDGIVSDDLMTTFTFNVNNVKDAKYENILNNGKFQIALYLEWK